MSYYGTTINDSAVIVVKAGEEIPAPAFLAVGADGKVATAGKNAKVKYKVRGGMYA